MRTETSEQAKIFILHKPGSWSSRLTMFFTGSTAMHIGFVAGDKLYDMSMLFRRRANPPDRPYYPPEHVKLYYCPVPLTAQDLEDELDTSNDWYGFLDYLAFGIKKLLPGFRPSFKGVICSEKVANILVAHDWKSPFVSVPSPADFEKVLIPL